MWVQVVAVDLCVGTIMTNHIVPRPPRPAFVACSTKPPTFCTARDKAGSEANPDKVWKCSCLPRSIGASMASTALILEQVLR